ncbi:MAG: DUF4139 domain-containing protein [Candidatus Omnitrophica bacterium]|nr:DUF4139 domain-containing protein [Candidatus Omnitrophota bacterium]
MKKIFIFLGLIVSFATESKEIKMVIYNQNFAVCDEEREIEIPSGKSTIIFTDIPKFIEPTSIQFYPLSNNINFSILEQVFDYDILNSEKVFSKNIGKKVDIITKDGQLHSGKLLFYDSGYIGIEEKDKISVLNKENLMKINFEIMELNLKPKLKFLIQSNKNVVQKFILKYITSNINWKADYVGEYNEEKNKLKINGFITIDNKTGTDYENVSLVLIAGEVKKIAEPVPLTKVGLAEKMERAIIPPFQESQVFEYHKYTLKTKTDIKDGEIKQINFLSKKDIKVDKKYVYDGTVHRYYHYDNWRNLPYNEKVEVLIEFKNEDEVLPSGKLRVFKSEKDGSLFIGENFISHTPIGEKVKLSLGNAFDIKGERKIISHEKISQQIFKDTYEIKIKNFKKEDVLVDIIEHLYGTWEILEKTHDYEKIDAYTIKFPVKVKNNDQVVLKYTVMTKF